MVVLHPRLVLLWAGIGLMVFGLAMAYDPQRAHARWLRHCAWGLALLLLWNALPLPHVGVNPLSAWLAGALGAPGLALLAVLARLP